MPLTCKLTRLPKESETKGPNALPHLCRSRNHCCRWPSSKFTLVNSTRLGCQILFIARIVCISPSTIAMLYSRSDCGSLACSSTDFDEILIRTTHCVLSALLAAWKEFRSLSLLTQRLNIVDSSTVAKIFIRFHRIMVEVNATWCPTDIDVGTRSSFNQMPSHIFLRHLQAIFEAPAIPRGSELSIDANIVQSRLPRLHCSSGLLRHNFGTMLCLQVPARMALVNGSEDHTVN